MATGRDEEAPSLFSLRQEARTIYGRDARGYEAGRPDYPAEVYEILTSRCGLRAGAAVVEIGAGTGLVTRRLVAAGARVTAVEPDENMAARLAATVGGDVEIIAETFERAPLPQHSFDLAVAATSFHWVDQAAGVPKLGRVIRPGGWAAVWWTIFDDPGREDAFRAALGARTGTEDPGGQRNAHFQLDAGSRRRDLTQLAGLIDVTGNLIRWTADLDTAQLRALYASMIRIRRLPPGDQRRILNQISQLADGDFGGRVRRPFVTALYTGRRPRGSR
ncbi:MAG TPA: methyltransferase domain-containing protein [Streptosporangiaceae bacterium]|nr:methyltransferase domain-containing protein [Streptosporangiaceae bacterium]